MQARFNTESKKNINKYCYQSKLTQLQSITWQQSNKLTWRQSSELNLVTSATVTDSTLLAWHALHSKSDKSVFTDELLRSSR